MKFTPIFLLLMLILLPACSGQATVGIFTPTLQPTLASIETPAPNLTPPSTPTLHFIKTSPSTPICSAVFSPIGFTPDGNSLVGFVQGMDSPGVTLQLLDIRTMVAKIVFITGEKINTVALSPNGQTFAWALTDFSIQLINLPDGKITATLTGHTGAIYALLFSPDGSRLFSTSADWSIKVWDIIGKVKQASFQPVFLDDNEPGEVQGLGISPDGKTLITIPTYGNPRAWDTSTFKQVGEYRGSMVAGYTGSHASYSPDGKYMAIGLAGGPGDTTLWRVADTTQLWSGGMMAGFAFSPDARLFAHTEQDANNQDHIVVRSADGQTVIQTTPVLSDTLITQLMFSPDSQMLVWMDGPLLRFWDIDNMRLVKTYTAPCQ